MNADCHFGHGILTKLSCLVDGGGVVMWPLLAVGLLTWTLLALRTMALQDARRAIRHWNKVSRVAFENGSLQLAARRQRLELHRHAAVIDTLIASAPLLGLLGTVSGMIATFEGLTTMSLHSEGGGVASGISMALLTTQAGLMIAIPAFFANKVLGRKIRKFEQKAEALLVGFARTTLEPGVEQA